MSPRNTPNAKRRQKYLVKISKSRRRTVFTLDRYQCVYCGLDMTKYPELRSLDHLTPLSSVMLTWQPRVVNAVSNLVTACLSCNNENANKPRSERHMVHGRFAIAPGAFLPLSYLVSPEGAW